MELILKRIFTCDSYTIGKLYINGEYFCDTIEDSDRGLTSDMTEEEIKEKKVYGETAIPIGSYDITMNVKSPKYSNFAKYKWAKPYDGYLPRLENVKGFEGILIHVGNFASNSLGCILVGLNNVKGQVTSSTVTFQKLMDGFLWKAKENNEDIKIIIEKTY